MSHPTVTSLLEETTADSPGDRDLWQIKIFVYFGVSVQPISLRTLTLTTLFLAKAIQKQILAIYYKQHTIWVMPDKTIRWQDQCDKNCKHFDFSSECKNL